MARLVQPLSRGMWWQQLLAVFGGLLLIWLGLLGLLWVTQRHSPDRSRMAEALRLLPDVIRLLLRRIAADKPPTRSP